MPIVWTAFFFLIKNVVLLEVLISSFGSVFGFQTQRKSDVITRSLTPKSKPTEVLSNIGFLIVLSSLVSTNTDTKYLPEGVLVTVTVFISPIKVSTIEVVNPTYFGKRFCYF